MKLLTPQEYSYLAFMASPHVRQKATRADEDVLDDLREQGRVWFEPEPLSDEVSGHWHMTDAGREALRMWPAIRAVLHPEAA